MTANLSSPHPLAHPQQQLASMDFFRQLSGNILEQISTPALLVSQEALQHNGRLLDQVRQQAPCRILLALKAFSSWQLLPLLRPYLSGVCASGLYEAQLGAEEFGGEVHSYSPAYSQAELEALLPLSKHIIFNSLEQWRRFRPLCQPWQGRVSCGLRVNLGCSVASVRIYDPSSPGSRLGISPSTLTPEVMEGIEGLHFHNLCEQGLEPLQRSLQAFEQSCRNWLPQLKWVNWGGGHRISYHHYDRAGLVRLIRDFRQRYSLEVVMEPGEATVSHCGLLLTRVLDLVPSNPPCAILDTSVTCHMPDVMEMPYRPDIWGAGKAGELRYTYQLGGRSCLAGDLAGLYSFSQPLQVGQVLIFDDMAHYTTVKSSCFNGVPLPGLWLYQDHLASCQQLRAFDYHDFKRRLG